MIVATVETTFWQSKVVCVLERLACVAAISLVCRFALGEDLTWLPWIVACVGVLIVVPVRWPYGALSVLIGLSAMPRLFVNVFGWKARPEHFAVALVSVACGGWLLVSRRKISLGRLDYWILAYVAANYVASAFGSVSPHETLRWALLNNLAVLPYFLIRLMVRDPETLRRAVRILLVVGVMESAYGILCYVSNHAFGTTTGMETAAYFLDIAAPYGSQYEPNLFGAYAGCCAILALTMYFIEDRRFGYLICFFIGSLATVLSLSRAALVALVIATGWLLWRRHRNKLGGRHRTSFIPAAALLLVIASPTISGVLRARFNDLFNQGLGEGTTITRLVEAQEALFDVPNHPLIGNGTASFQLSFDWGRYEPTWGGRPTWVGNMAIRILHDCGLLGLATLLGFAVSLGAELRLSLHAKTRHAALLVGLSAGALLYGISFQATDGTMLAFPWVHLGLLASAAIVLRGCGVATARPSAQYGAQ